MSLERAPISALRVGYVVRSWPRLSQTFIVQEIRALEQRGVEVEVYSLSRSDETLVQREVAALRAPVVHLDPPATPVQWLTGARRVVALAMAHPVVVGRVLLGRRWERGYHAASRLVCLSQAAQLAARVRAGRRSGRRLHHLHAHFAHDPAGVASIVSATTGVPFSFTAHARDIFQLDRSLLAERVAGAAATVTICDANLSHIRSLARPQDDGRIHLVHNGLDLHEFPEAEHRDADGPLRIVTIARLVEKKGLDDLVAACAGLRRAGVDFTCRIFGDGPLQSSLSSTISRHQLDGVVTLEGSRTRAELVEVLASSDVFALLPFVTADGDRDGIPTVLVEAMACGLPVVSTAVAGIPDLVRHDHNGLLLQPRDVAGATSALVRLASNPSERQRLGRAARRTVETDFDAASSAAQIEAIFRGRVHLRPDADPAVAWADR